MVVWKVEERKTRAFVDFVCLLGWVGGRSREDEGKDEENTEKRRSGTGQRAERVAKREPRRGKE
jgi:hypothetical protein